MAYKWNPFTGNFDQVIDNEASNTTEFAQKVAEEFDCLATAQVGDIVVPSTTTPNLVEELDSNVYDNLAFGIVIEKLTLTTCKVLISGKLAGASYGLSGLTFGKPLFIGTDGSLTTTVPATGHLQKMGIAVKADTIFLLPTMEKVVR